MAGQKKRNHHRDQRDRMIIKTTIEGDVEKEVRLRFDSFPRIYCPAFHLPNNDLTNISKETNSNSMEVV